MTAVKTKGLTYRYGVGTPFEIKAVDSVSLDIKKGNFIGIIGHTGSGKSTFIQHLNGLLKPTDGEIFINERNIWSKEVDIRSIRFEVGLVFQYSEHQLFEETVFKDIAFGPRNIGLSEEEVKARVYRAAEAMGVHENWLSRSPFDLSGGQKRRVALAGVIAMEPKILVLDEPAAGLDPYGRDKVLSKIKEYHESSGITILLVSHSMEDIVKYADKVIVMNKGGVFLYEETDKVFSHADEIVQIGLDVPQITRFARLLRQKGFNIGDDVYTVERAKARVLEVLKNGKYE
ncbi:MAG: energy-coupling factor transporter ATPase [Oscillospiraceae bacterium]|nr:energy-coupling factor transporter ATPase [Oscillospiraceae bacterium]